MSGRLAAELGGIIESLAQAPWPTASASLAEVAEHVAKGFGVGPDEVAILILIAQGKFLKFLIPEKLQAVGTIPMTDAGPDFTPKELHELTSITGLLGRFIKLCEES